MTVNFGPVRPDKVEELRQRMLSLGLREEDLDESFVRAQGRGGQKVNKTSVAVVLKHPPSGIVVKVQRERSRAINRYLARRTLCEKLEKLARQKRTSDPSSTADVRS
ncbi:MAG: peptide chain release factor-like protein [Pseudomonadota bacterium]